jgi:hypothetical protein
MAGRRAGDPQLGEGVHPEDVLNVFGRDVFQGAEVLYSRVADTAVQPTELLDGVIDDAVGDIGVADIAAYRNRGSAAGAKLGDQSFGGVPVHPVVHRYRRTVLGDPMRDGCADSTATPGYQNPLACQIHVQPPQFGVR